jgi:hypothetical protein
MTSATRHDNSTSAAQEHMQERTSDTASSICAILRALDNIIPFFHENVNQKIVLTQRVSSEDLSLKWALLPFRKFPHFNKLFKWTEIIGGERLFKKKVFVYRLLQMGPCVPVANKRPSADHTQSYRFVGIWSLLVYITSTQDNDKTEIRTAGQQV